jgi:uncharacterized protein (DUF1697 family)
VTRQVVLLRAVNVGGRKLAMADLRRALTDAGCRAVETYIQSGNAVLEPPEDRPASGAGLAAWLEAVISDEAGFPVPVVCRSASELRRTVDRNPFPQAGGKLLHVVFLADSPPPGALDQVQAVPPEAFQLVGPDLYLHLPNGMGRSKLPLELDRAGRKLTPPTVATARNWNTVLELLARAER